MRNIAMLLLFELLLLQSCNLLNSEKREIKKEILSWTGKQIYFPKDLKFKLNNVDTICPQLYRTEFKILVYVDSTGCTPCKLNIFNWKELIMEVNEVNKNVSFLFYINAADYKIVEQTLLMNRFDYPVIIDKENKINKMNHFSSNSMFHIFLLDRDDKVLLLGNPIGNQRLKKLYIEQLLK